MGIPPLKGVEPSCQDCRPELKSGKKYSENGITQDLDLAFKWFTLVAGQNIVHSQYMLGKMYENGEGCVKDMETAVYWYKRLFSASHHDPRQHHMPDDDPNENLVYYSSAEVRPGDIYYYGEGGIQQNFKTAFTYFNRAARAWKVSVYAKYMTAKMYDRGVGIKQNLEKALIFYKQAVRWSGKAGYQDAQEKVEELSEYLTR
jgi:TPR repeat protein